MEMNRRGWIKIIEAFFAAVLVIAVIAVVVSQQQANSTGSQSPQIYNYEISIINVIQSNSTLRQDILNVPSSEFPVNSDSSNFPAELNNTIHLKTPGSLQCNSEVCGETGSCDFWKNSSSSIYAQAILITATQTTYSPRVLKLFCWES